MTAFFAAGAVVIALALSSDGWPAVPRYWNQLRQTKIDNSKAQQELDELEEEAKRLRDPQSDAVEILIRDQLQWQKKDELRIKPAEPSTVKEKKLPFSPPMIER